MSVALQSIQAELARIADDAGGIASSATVAPAAAQDGAEAPTAGGFADSLKRAFHAVDDQDRDAADQAAAVDSGRSDDLVGAMLSSQQANLSFSMLMQVRNKVVGAVDELIKLQL